MALWDKFGTVQGRLDNVKKLINKDPLGVEFDDIMGRTRGRIGNREIILAGTNNYLGLTFDEACMDAAKAAIDAHGTGTTGSRVANGTYTEHVELEKALADHFGMPSCIIFSTGYQTNLAAISGLTNGDDIIFMDADAHACIIDGTRLSDASTIRFRHNNPEDLDKRMSRVKEKKGDFFVIIEGLYSMFGDIAPIDEFLDVTHKHGGYLYIDEAHSYGVFGETGCGLAEAQGVMDRVDFISGTFSKSLASIGGFCVSKHPEFEIARKVMRPYLFTASPTPSNVSTALAAVGKINSPYGDGLRKNIWNLAKRLHKGLDELGYDLCADPSPVIAARRPNEVICAMEWDWLLENGLYVNLAVPPGTPQSSSLLRISLSAAHTEDDVDQIIGKFKELKEVQPQLMENLMKLAG